MARKNKAGAEVASSSGVKRSRLESAAGVDEDAFEIGRYRVRTKHAAPPSIAGVDEPGETMDQCRICPRVLVEALEGLNDHQRRAVQDIDQFR